MAANTGPDKNPYPVGSDLPDGPAAFVALGQRLTLMKGAGIGLVANIAALAASITNGDAFPGWTVYVSGLDAMFRYSGGVYRLHGTPRVADAAARDALFDGATTVRQPGDRVYRIDREWTEEYMDLAPITAGWYPIAGALPNVMASRGASQSFTSGTVTVVAFPPVSGTNLVFDNANATAIIPVAGRYRVRGSLAWQGGGAVSLRGLYVALNGTGSAQAIKGVLKNTNALETQDIETEATLAAGDLVRLLGLQQSGIALSSYTGGGAYNTELAVQYIGPARA